MIHFNYKKFILVVSIMVVWNLFVAYGINTFYPEPKYDNFCKREQVVKMPKNEQECVSSGGQWTDNAAIPRKIPSLPVGPAIEEPVGWCDTDFTCRQEYEKENNVYRRDVFVVFVLAGIFAIIGGIFITTAEAISTGFSFGGIISILIGTMRYWSAMEDYLRFIVLGIALAILIWIGWKKIK